MVKIINWNVNGLRTRILDSNIDSSNFKTMNEIKNDSPLGNLLKEYDADIICFCETRCSIETAEKFKINKYYKFWNSSKGIGGRMGDRYSGVAIWTKIKPNSVIDYLPTLIVPNNEGRILTLYYDNFILIHTYQPNSGTNYEFRTKYWDPAILEYLEILNNECKCPIIFTGDLNVAHTPFDLHTGEPKNKQIENYHKTTRMLGTSKNTPAGFTKLERDNFSKLLNSGFIDVYRFINPYSQFNGYTWWDMRIKPYRELNKGWRIDYFLINRQYKHLIQEFLIFKHIGENLTKIASDHAPIGFTIEL